MMHSYDLIVHFEGPQLWCGVVRVSNNETLCLSDIVSVALDRYNSIFHTFYEPDQTKVGIIQNYEKIAMVENPESKKFTESPKDEEIIIYLPLQEEKTKATVEKLSYEELEKYKRLSSIFYQMEYYGAAKICNNIVQVQNNLYGEESDNKNWIELEDKNVFEKEEKSFKDRVQQLIYNNLQPNELKKELLELAKIEPTKTIYLILQCYDCYDLLPIICEGNPTATKYFIETISEINLKIKNLLFLAEPFVNSGDIETTLQILSVPNNDNTLTNVKFYLYFLLQDYQLARMYIALLNFFKMYSIKQIGNINLNSIFVILTGIKHWPSHQFSINTKDKKPKEINSQNDNVIFTIFQMTAIFLLISGEFNRYNTLMTLLKPYNPHLEQIAKNEYNYSSWNLYKFSCAAYSRFRPPITTKRKIFALGDEYTLHASYIKIPEYGNVIPHPIQGIQICYLEEDRKSYQKTAFWNRIKEISTYKVLILFLGTNDLKLYFPFCLMHDENMTFQSFVNNSVQLYVKIIEKIHTMHPNIKIIVHSLFDLQPDSTSMFKAYNEILQNNLPEYVSFLDISVDPDNISKCSIFGNEGECNVDYTKLFLTRFSELKI